MKKHNVQLRHRLAGLFSWDLPALTTPPLLLTAAGVPLCPAPSCAYGRLSGFSVLLFQRMLQWMSFFFHVYFGKYFGACEVTTSNGQLNYFFWKEKVKSSSKLKHQLYSHRVKNKFSSCIHPGPFSPLKGNNLYFIKNKRNSLSLWKKTTSLQRGCMLNTLHLINKSQLFRDVVFWMRKKCTRKTPPWRVHISKPEAKRDSQRHVRRGRGN